MKVGLIHLVEPRVQAGAGILSLPPQKATIISVSVAVVGYNTKDDIDRVARVHYEHPHNYCPQP